MKREVFVCNASPLIAFERLDRSELLQTLTHTLLIPTAVRTEVFGREGPPDWIEERMITQPLSAKTLSPRLGPGESEAIALALEIGDCYLLLDDLLARRLAEALHVSVIGTVGLLVLARRRGLVDAVRPLLDALLAVDFRVSKRLYNQVIRSVGE